MQHERPPCLHSRSSPPPRAPLLGPWHDQRAGRHSAKETGMATPASVEAYLAACPEDSRAALEHLRALIKAAAPEATETISYQMPAFRAHGRMLVWMGAFRDHCSLFPGSMALIAAHKDEPGGLRRREGDDPVPPGQPPSGCGRREDRKGAPCRERGPQPSLEAATSSSVPSARRTAPTRLSGMVGRCGSTPTCSTRTITEAAGIAPRG
jgi:hypothetical protein